MANTLADLAREQARTRGDHVAFTFEGVDLTYAELDARASRVASALTAEGIGRGDRVAFLDKNVPELFELAFGAAKVGAVIVPVNRRLTGPEMAQIIRDATARLLVVGSELDATIREVEAELTTLRLVLSTADGGPRESFTAWRDAQPADDPELTTSPDDVVAQFYTSGTTGLPKGVMLTNASMFALHSAANGVLRLSSDSVCLVTMPLFHVAGAGWALYGLMNGSHNVMLRDIDLPEILEAIPRYGITHTVFVPALLMFLLATPGIEDADLSSLEAVIYGASPISETVLLDSMARFGCPFFQMYGLTETDGGVVVLPPEDHVVEGPNAHRLHAAGLPLPGVHLRVVDEDGRDLAPGEVGEVWIRSPSNMAGYWNMPEATAATLTDDGWLKSGDAGYLDADGYLYIHDRVKDMIISGGENVYPAEVENVLTTHPGVADAAVIAVPDDRWGETVKAVIVPSEAGVTNDELIRYCRERLAHYKCPTSVDRTDVLPRNPSGKILKRELREPYWGDHDRRVH